MTQPRNTIRTFALICVAVALLFIMGMSYWLTKILAAPDWCGRAINAEKLAESRQTSSVELCKDLLLEQVNAIANNSHIYAFSIALCLVALMLIVVAGGRLSFKASKAGAEVDLSRDDPGDDPAVKAATEVAGAAVNKAAEIKEEVKDEPTGPRPGGAA